MISGRASKLSRSAAFNAASITARTCISMMEGRVIPRRQSCHPNMGFTSCADDNHLFQLREGGIELGGKGGETVLVVERGEEFVEGGVEEADGDVVAVHGFEDAFEVGSLVVEEVGDGGLGLGVVAED